MSSSRKFYRTIVTIEVLSEDRIIGLVTDLEDLNKFIDTGGGSGHVEVGEPEEVDGPTMAKLLQAQGSYPEFFGLTEDGEDEDEDAA